MFSTANTKQIWAVGARVVPSSSERNFGLPESRGTILHSADGEPWVAQSRSAEAILYSLFGTPDAKQLWAVGERVAQDGKRSGTIVHSTDGENWDPQYNESDVVLFWVFGTPDGRHLWAVGGSGVSFAPDGTQGWAAKHSGVILHSTDGKHWAAQASPTEAILYSVFGTADGKQLWAVGGFAPTREQVEKLLSVEERGTILHSTDGEHWATLELPVFPPTHYEHNLGIQTPVPTLYSIFGTADGRELWAAGERGTILHSADGQHWSVQHWSVQHPEELPSNNSLNSIFGTSDAKRLWAVGGGFDSERHCTILYSSDGNHWTDQSCGTNIPLYSIWGGSNARQLWAVGEDGTILHSTDGEHWANHRTSSTFPGQYPEKNFKNYTFQPIFGTADGRRLWVTGSSPQQPLQLPIQTPPPGPPTVGILLQGEIPVHAPYVASARLHSTPMAARLELKLRVPTDLKGRVDVNFQARNDFDFEHNRPAPELAAQIQYPTKASPDIWSFDFDPSKAAVGRGQRGHFEITLDDGLLKQHFDYTAIYDPFRFFRDNAKWIVLLAAVLLILGCFTLLLFVKPLWNLYLYKRFKLHKIGDISIPGIGDLLKAVLRTLAVLPWYVKRPRTLDAWIQHNREALATAWNNDIPQTRSTEGRDPEFSGAYVQLPVRIGNPAAGSLLQQPAAEDFTVLIGESRCHLQIVGPGGAGKTTLAQQIGRWALDGSVRAGKGRHKMIPIWIDEDLSEINSLSKVIRDKLYASLPNEELENDFCDVLLRKQRLLVIVDRLSERSGETQSYMRKIYRSTRLSALIVTSRTSSPVDGLVPTSLFPQPLNSASLLFFMTSLLATFAVNKSESGSGEVGPLGTTTEQLQLGQRLASLIELRTPDGKEEIPLLPLQVRLFVEQAIGFLSIGKTLDDLPTSLPDVYVQYLKQVNPKTSAASNFLSDEEMLKAAKTLGKLALQPNYVPKEFSPEAAREALKSNGWASFDRIDPIERLKSNGVLFHREVGAYTRLRFALDPIAEFLGAFAYAEECGSNRGSWNQILENSASAPGFQIALKLIRQAYGAQLGWALDQT